ncbi:hypothetical protein MAR_031752, partial [Mya arenaria]
MDEINTVSKTVSLEISALRQNNDHDVITGVDDPDLTSNTGVDDPDLTSKKATFDIGSNFKLWPEYEQSPRQKRIRNHKAKQTILKKNFSEPEMYKYRVENNSSYQNHAFDFDEVSMKQSISFADIVTQYIRAPIREDIHPYGRGHLYRSVMEDNLPKIHHGEGRFLMWFVATVIIAGFAVG